MSICCITGYGKRIRNEKGLIIIDPPVQENGKAEKAIVNPDGLSLVLINGDHGISTSAIRILLNRGIEMVLLDDRGMPSGFLFPCAKCTMIENMAWQSTLPEKKRLIIARAMVGQAVRNKMSLLASVWKNAGKGECRACAELSRFAERAKKTEFLSDLLGIEGMATRMYYRALTEIVPKPFGFHGRTRHPPRDPVNSLMSYGYGILYGVIRMALLKAKLSPFYGVLHADYRKQEPLVYDFIEEFRQPIVDRTVLTLINHKQVDPSEFEITPAGCRIATSLKRSYAEAVLSRLDARYEYAGQRQPFSSVIDVQARHLAAALLKQKAYRPFAYR
ncbi:MAG: CRISPR-associated endonuclease Cas1 2 [Methanoregula sp. PtaU1.Bin051]|nr:MAG: CRISPR-associated endonuclease Cas1 2 [Methanoregula sp. PtaU1.Bin051]